MGQDDRPRTLTVKQEMPEDDLDDSGCFGGEGPEVEEEDPFGLNGGTGEDGDDWGLQDQPYGGDEEEEYDEDDEVEFLGETPVPKKRWEVPFGIKEEQEDPPTEEKPGRSSSSGGAEAAPNPFATPAGSASAARLTTTSSSANKRCRLASQTNAAGILSHPGPSMSSAPLLRTNRLDSSATNTMHGAAATGDGLGAGTQRNAAKVSAPSAMKKTQPVLDAAEFIGGRMEDQFSTDDMDMIVEWLGFTNLECEGPARCGDFYKDLRATRNFQQWKSIARKKTTLPPETIDGFFSRAKVFKAVFENSTFTNLLPFR